MNAYSFDIESFRPKHFKRILKRYYARKLRKMRFKGYDYTAAGAC